MRLKNKLYDLLEQNERFRLLACVLSGIFSSVPFFFEDLFLVSWISAVPFFCVLFSGKSISLKRVFLYGFLFHFSRSVIVLSWLKELYSMSALSIPPFLMICVILVAVIGLSALQAIPFGISCTIISLISKKSKYNFVLVLSASLLFTGSELINTLIEMYHPFGAIGFPWVLAYVSQGSFLSGIQASSLFGAHFVSFIIYAFNCLLSQALIKCGKVQKICAILSICLFTLNTSYGIITLSCKSDSSDFVKVLAYQDNNSSYSKWTTSATDTCDIFIEDMENKYDFDTMPNIIVLSETVFPVRMNTGSSGAYIKNALCDFTDKYDNIVVAGSFLYDDTGRYNAQFFFENGTLCDTVYKKRTLVPFGEYVPYENVLNTVFPFMEEFNLSGSSLDKGNGAFVAGCSKAKLGGLICYDSIFYYNAIESAKDGAQVLIVSTNDSWYNDSAAAYQHFTQSVFRAIETGKPVVRSATTGISGIIDAQGRTLSETKLLQKDDAEANILPNSKITPFVKYGYTWYYLLCAADLILILFSCLKRRKEK